MGITEIPTRHGVLWELNKLVFVKYLEYCNIAWHIVNINKHLLSNEYIPLYP